MTETRYAILIGNSEFPNEPEALPNLRCPEQDVDDFHELLTSADYGLFAPEHITVLKNKTRLEIEHELHRVITGAAKDDLILIYYSGHGKLNKANRLHLTTRDTEVARLEPTSVSTRTLSNLLEDYPRNRVILILDCCYAGHIETDWINRGVEEDTLPASLGGCGTYIITATAKFQTAKERNEDRNGLLTKHLLDGIRNGAADAKQLGFITIGDLFEYAEPRVQSESETQQKPKMWSLKADGGGIHIARSNYEPRRERAERIRKRLAQLIASGNREFIAILSEADRFLELPTNELDSVQQRRDALLEQLNKEQISLLSFYRDWSLLETASATIVTPPISEVAELVVQTPVAYQTGDVIRDSLKDGSPGPEMVFIQGGSFKIGSPETEEGRSENERLHPIEVSDFFIAKYPVTRTEYQHFVTAAGYKENDEWRNPDFKQDDNHPVVNVSWHDAMAYAEWLSNETGQNYCLLSEAEWEYAARGGTKTAYWWGDQASYEYANYSGHPKWKYTSPVGSFPANPYGLFDNLGNVWEWTGSEYDADYNGAELGNKSKNNAIINKAARALRGGSWYFTPAWVRAAHRFRWRASNRSNDAGFRLARS